MLLACLRLPSMITELRLRPAASESAAPFLYFHPQYCVGCAQRASDVLCGGCFEALPLVGCPFCARCGAPTAFELYGCGECSNREVPVPSHRARLAKRGFNQAELMARGVA